MDVKTIAKINDEFREKLVPDDFNDVFISLEVSFLEDDELEGLKEMIRKYNNFNDDNDPYGEHDMGSLTYNSRTYFFKIDYFKLGNFNEGADPYQEKEVSRVMTIMHASEY
jgi:hypothetical protein